MLKGKTVVLGVSGGIAAYKVCELVSRLKKAEADVHVVMTENAARFVAPLTFETLSGNRVISDMFDRDFPWEVEHISLAKKADIFVLAPCTANLMAKLACGIADDFLSTTLLAAVCPVLIAPAMNTNMLDSPATKSNMALLARRGCLFVEAGEGRLACGDNGRGRLAEIDDIFNKIAEVLYSKRDFEGKTFMITAGATREPIDPVRFITNRSSGKMGQALASAVKRRGGKVLLVCGIVKKEPRDYDELINVQTTDQMYDAVMSRLGRCDYIIKAAAPADYKIDSFSEDKLKSQTLNLKLSKNPDIAKAAGEKKGDKKLIIFCAENKNLESSAREKLKNKNADMVVANDVSLEGAGFDVDTNIVTIITHACKKDIPKTSKSALADLILDEIALL